MSNLSQFMGAGAPPKSIINYFSDGGTHAGVTQAKTAGKQYLSGNPGADTYNEVLAVSSPGVLDICLACPVDATERTVGLKVVIDGTTVFDAVTDALTSADNGIVAVGIPQPGSWYGVAPQPLSFNTLSVSVKTSIAENNKAVVTAVYRTI
jgi:hypothetical protein